MYLFETEKGMINVYSFDIDKNKAADFRRKEMKRIYQSPKVFHVLESVKRGNKPIFTRDFNGESVTKKEIANVTFYPYNCGDEKYVLQEYYNGKFVDSKNPYNLLNVKRSLNSQDHDQYFLVGYSSYESKPFIVYGESEAYKVIKIPKSLYLLGAIEQKQFKLVESENIERELDLFRLKQVDQLNISQLLLADYYGISNMSSRLKTELDKCKPFLKQLKKC